jgi:hypothetical protein
MLIDCIECENKISDKSSNCTKCGCPTTASIDALKKICEECGNYVSATDKVCSECGAPYGAQPSSESTDTKGSEEYDFLSAAEIERLRSLEGMDSKSAQLELAEQRLVDALGNDEHPFPLTRDKIFSALLVFLPTFLMTFIVISVQTTAIFYHSITSENFVITAIAAVMVGGVVAYSIIIAKEAFTLTLFGLVVVFLGTLFITFGTGYVDNVVDQIVNERIWINIDEREKFRADQFLFFSHLFLGFLPHAAYAVAAGFILFVTRNATVFIVLLRRDLPKIRRAFKEWRNLSR